MFNAGDYNPVERFCGLAAVYAKSRPTYPDEALHFIVRGLTPSARVADIGSGTGILARELAGHGFEVTGVEPNAHMREEAERTPCPAAVPPHFVAGHAEETGLPAASTELIVAAQAFHWFDADRSLREFHRVLIPGGRVALVWNNSDGSDELTGSFWHALREFATEPGVVREPHHVTGRELLRHALFTAAEVRTFPNRQVIDEAGFLGRAESASFAPRDGPRLDELIGQLRALFARFQTAGSVTLRYQTFVYTASARVGVGGW